MDFDWRVTTFETVCDFAARLSDRAVVAVDGRSAGGKTSFARRLADAIDGARIVHTDDIAWHHGVLNWDHLLRDGVLRPFRAGLPVSYRPPQYDLRGRAGAIEVPASCPLLIVEGVGSGRLDLAGEYDAVVWVETDVKLTEERDGARMAAGEVSTADYESWMAEEIPFQAAQRTWERADLVVAGYPAVPYDPAAEVLLAAQPARR